MTPFIDANSHTTSWGYDVYGRVTNKVGATSASILQYKYDADNRLTNRWSIAKGNTAYAYDKVGNLTGVTYPISHGLSFSYNAMNWMTSMADGIGTTTFGYTAAGQLSSESGPWASDTVSYTYSDRVQRGQTVALSK